MGSHDRNQLFSMRRAVLIFLSVLAFVLVTSAAAVVFLATAGDEFYRWALRQAIEGSLERRVVVDGTFSFDVGLELCERNFTNDSLSCANFYDIEN